MTNIILFTLFNLHLSENSRKMKNYLTIVLLSLSLYLSLTTSAQKELTLKNIKNGRELVIPERKKIKLKYWYNSELVTLKGHYAMVDSASIILKTANYGSTIIPLSDISEIMLYNYTNLTFGGIFALNTAVGVSGLIKWENLATYSIIGGIIDIICVPMAILRRKFNREKWSYHFK